MLSTTILPCCMLLLWASTIQCVVLNKIPIISSAIFTPSILLNKVQFNNKFIVQLWQRLPGGIFNNKKKNKKNKEDIFHKQPEKVDVVVVGAGLCGSSAAFYLNKQGFQVLLAEQAPEVGGCLVTKQVDGFLWEEGANSFQPSATSLQFADDIGLLKELILANASLPRYIFWKNKLHKLPTSFKEFLSSNLLSTSGKIRLASGLMGMVRPRRETSGEETVEQFATRHLGEEVFTRIVDPFISGVYAGDPAELSVDAAFKRLSALEAPGISRSILEGALVNSLSSKYSRVDKLPPSSSSSSAKKDDHLASIPKGSLGSFRRGLQSLPLQVKKILGSKCKTSFALQRIEPSQDGRWLTTFSSGDGGYKIYTSRSVLLTTPAHITAKLLGNNFSQSFPTNSDGIISSAGSNASNSYSSTDVNNSSSISLGLDKMPLSPEAARQLALISYPPVVAVILAYPDTDLMKPLEGFGHLIPRANKVRSLGSIWASSLFAGRAPEGYTLILTFIGGTQDAGIVELSQESIVKQVDEDLKQTKVLKPEASSPRVMSVKVWRQAIPQYNKGHLSLISTVLEEVKRMPGLFLGGNYVSGVSVGDCIGYGVAISQNISSYLLSTRYDYLKK